MRVVANNTAKRRLRDSVGLVHVPTATRARCITSINRFNLDAVLAGHVPDLGEQRCERHPCMINRCFLAHLCRVRLRLRPSSPTRRAAALEAADPGELA